MTKRIADAKKHHDEEVRKAEEARNRLLRAIRGSQDEQWNALAFAWQGEVPDPQAERTFVACRLSWSWPEGSPRAGLRRIYGDLLAARRQWPALAKYTERIGALFGTPEQFAALFSAALIIAPAKLHT